MTETLDVMRRYRAGDEVEHTPSGETWVLACDEDEQGDVHPAGWPESVASADDCVLVKEASDDERLKMLRDAAALSDHRGNLARRQLEAGA